MRSDLHFSACVVVQVYKLAVERPASRQTEEGWDAAEDNGEATISPRLEDQAVKSKGFENLLSGYHTNVFPETKQRGHSLSWQKEVKPALSKYSWSLLEYSPVQESTQSSDISIGSSWPARLTGILQVDSHCKAGLVKLHIPM